MEIEPRIKIRNGLKVNQTVTKLHCIPWTIGRVTLMGDSGHTQGPEGGIGLNFNYSIARSFRDFLKSNNGSFRETALEIEEKFQQEG